MFPPGQSWSRRSAGLRQRPPAPAPSCPAKSTAGRVFCGKRLEPVTLCLRRMQVAVVLLGAAFPAGSGAFAPRAAFNPAPPQRPGIPSGPGRASLPLAEHGAGAQLQHRRGLRLLRLPRLPRFRTALASSAPRDNATTPAESAAALPDAPRRTVFGVDIRLVVLCLLVVQNACQMMSMRYSRVGE